MHRKFLRDALICLIPILIAGLLCWSAYAKYQEGRGGFKLGVDLVGGTILVYEIDAKLTGELRGGGHLALGAADAPNAASRIGADEMSQLAAALKRRIDPADLRNVTIRPVGQTRVEIVLPTGGQRHSDTNRSDFSLEEVEAIKALIRRVGSLEFRILANEHDDAEAYEAAKNFFNLSELEKESKEKADERRKLLELHAREGLPPPFPVKGKDEQPYISLGEATDYAWVELGKEERQTLKLDNAQETEQTPSELWREMAKARAENRTYTLVDVSEGLRTTSLVYSRDCINTSRLSQAEAKEKKYEYFMLTRSSDSVKVGGNITITATVETGNNLRPAVGFTFNSVGARAFFNVTKKNEPDRRANIARQLAILLDGMLTSAPRIISAISDKGQITGNYTHKDAVQLVNILRSGALTAVLKPQPVSENTIGPTLGADTIRSGTLAVGLAFLAVLLFMLFYYRFAGIVASIALLANLLLTIGFMVAVNATFTLPGLAGLVLMLGMAVDANVLIYERLREERDRGASLPVAIRNGYDRAFGTIIDTHLTSILTAIILYTVGNDQLKGFGVSLTVGLIISLFTSLFMTRLMFDYWMRRGWLKRLKMLRLFSRPSINFMRIRKPVFVATVAITVLGLALFLYHGERGLNVDFIGGTAYGGQMSKTNPRTKDGVDIGTLRALMSEDRQKHFLNVDRVEEVSQEAAAFPNTYRIHYADGSSAEVTLSNAPLGGEGSKEEREANVRERAAALPDSSVEQIQMTGDAFGKSRYFTVRTTEKEPELVQIAIDRLFREDPTGGEKLGETLLAKTGFRFKKSGETGWELLFFDADDPDKPAPTSPSYVKTLIEREFRIKLGDKLGTNEPFSLQGIDEKPVEGRHVTMRLQPTPALLKLDVDVAKILESAKEAFASRPQPERLETFDATLASEMRARALYAILASWLGILLYLWFRFGSWTFGAAAVLCLIHDLCFTLGVIAACHFIHDNSFFQLLKLQDFKIDLPAVAALLTLVGYSVNDTIVVFDRIREVRGKNPLLTETTINDSVNQTLSRTVLASLTVFLVVGVLYWFGGEGVHLFAFVMVVGVIVGTFSSIYVASPLLLMLGEGRPQTHQQHQALRAAQAESPA